MLLDTRTKGNPDGFNPNVQNQEIHSASDTLVGWWILFIFSWLFIIPGIILTVKWIKWGNDLNRMQMQANNAASSIDIQLTKRSETLVKLVDATKSSMKFEAKLLTDVTSMRGVKVNANNRNQVSQQMDSAFARLLATAENYPQIKSTDTVRQLMSSAEYIEREIASSREVYNAIVTEFNKWLFTWPTKIIAAKKSLHTLPLYEASSQQKQDVSLKMEI